MKVFLSSCGWQLDRFVSSCVEDGGAPCGGNRAPQKRFNASERSDGKRNRGRTRAAASRLEGRSEETLKGSSENCERRSAEPPSHRDHCGRRANAQANMLMQFNERGG